MPKTLALLGLPGDSLELAGKGGPMLPSSCFVLFLVSFCRFFYIGLNF